MWANRVQLVDSHNARVGSKMGGGIEDSWKTGAAVAVDAPGG